MNFTVDLPTFVHCRLGLYLWGAYSVTVTITK